MPNMADKVKDVEGEMLPPPPPYPGQQGNFPAQLGYLAQPGYPAQPSYLAQPGYPQQPYSAQLGYSGLPPYTGQPMGHSQPYPGMQAQQSTTTVVMQPSHEVVILPAAPRPQNWRILSIVTLVCCPSPIPVAAFVFSSMVESSYNAGDYEGARRNSKIALCLNIASIICFVCLLIFFFIYF